MTKNYANSPAKNKKVLMKKTQIIPVINEYMYILSMEF